MASVFPGLNIHKEKYNNKRYYRLKSKGTNVNLHIYVVAAKKNVDGCIVIFFLRVENSVSEVSSGRRKSFES